MGNPDFYQQKRGVYHGFTIIYSGFTWFYHHLRQFSLNFPFNLWWFGSSSGFRSLQAFDPPKLFFNHDPVEAPQVPSLRNLIKAGAGDFWGHGGHGFLSLKSPWGVLGVFFQFSASHSSGKKPHINRGIYIPTWDKAVKNTRHWFNYSSGVFLFPFFFCL